jgi:serine/threonine protein kinase/WD40 repeat protein
MSRTPLPELTEIEALLCGLFDAPAAQWPEQLEVLCEANPRHASELRRRFELLRSTGFDAPPEPPGDLARAFDFPERLGEFRLLRRLGSGGMGMVFAAEQPSLGREVALKVVRPELLFSDGARERFRREIESIARLEHPAIVPVLTHGEDRGVPYYVMPLVRGCSCDEVIRRLGDLDPARASGADLQRAIAGEAEPPADADGVFAGSYWQACVRLLRQAALGLQHAHRRGIVHRDVKPSNLLLTPDGRALVLDFGLAHVHDDARITRSGSAPGSPAYMAPEQMRGQPADARSDVYSLAATLHHLLALACPFPIEDSEVLRGRILAGRAEPLRTGAAPRDLAMVLAAAMDVDRDRRHADAQALADDLNAVLEQRPIRARPLPWSLRSRRWLQRHPALATGLGLGALLLAGTPTIVAIGIAGQRDRARAAEVEASRNAYEANIAAANTALQSGDCAETRRRLDACPEALRGFEWHHLQLALDGSLRTFSGHSGRVTAVAITDDAERMASGDRHGNLLLWEPLRGTGSRRVALTGRGAIVEATFVGDGRRLIVLQEPEGDFGPGDDPPRSARVADFATAEVVAEREPLQPRERLQVTSGGGALLVSRSDFTVDELDPATLIRRRTVQLDPVGDAPDRPFTSDGARLFLPAADGLQVWRLADGQAEVLPGTITRSVVAMASANGLGVCATVDGRLIVGYGEPLRARALDHPVARHYVLALDASGTWLVGLGAGGAVRTWHAREGRLVATVHGAPELGTAVAVASRRLLVAVGGDAGRLQLFGAFGSRDRQTLVGHSGVVSSLATTANGILLSGAHEAAVRSWAPGSGEPCATSRSVRHWINAMAVGAGGEDAFVTSFGFVVRMRLPDLEWVDEYATGAGWILHLLALPDGRLLASTTDRRLLLIDHGRRAIVAERELPGGRPYCAALAPDGRHVFTGGEGAILNWQVDGGIELHRSTPAAGRVVAIACRQDGALLYASENNGSMLSARAASDGRVSWQRSCSSRALSLWLLPDQSRLVSGHVDGSVTLWDPADGRCMVTLRTGQEAIRALSGDPAGRWIAASSDPTITLFRATTEDDGFAARLALSDTFAAMFLDQELRSELKLRADVLAAIDQRTDLDEGLRRRMAHDEGLRPPCTWEEVAEMLTLCMVSGQPAARYDRALRIAEAALANDRKWELGLTTAAFATLRLGRPAQALQLCDATLAEHSETPGLALRAARIIALSALGRTAEAREELGKLQRLVRGTTNPERDDLRLFFEAERAVGK